VPAISEHHWTSRGYVCVDGQHRLKKARRIGIKTLPAVEIRIEQHIPFLYKGYVQYADYWNGKLKNVQRMLCGGKEKQSNKPMNEQCRTRV
jgi:hypothetical protein